MGCWPGAEVDITPPPGMPKAGHSKTPRTGRFRTRLRAGHTPAGWDQSLALVAADMHAVRRRASTGRPSHRGRDRRPDVGLFLERPIPTPDRVSTTAATSTNRWASNRSASMRLHPFPERADRRSGPARLLDAPTGQTGDGSVEVWGFTRNRSLSAHVDNAAVTDKRLEPQRKYASINPGASDPGGRGSRQWRVRAARRSRHVLDPRHRHIPPRPGLQRRCVGLPDR